MSDQELEFPVVDYAEIGRAYHSLSHHASVLIACKGELGRVTRAYKKALARATGQGKIHQKEHGTSVAARDAHADDYLAGYLDAIDLAEQAVTKADKKHEVAKLRLSQIKLNMQLQGQIVEKQRLDDARDYLQLISQQPSINLVDMVDSGISPADFNRHGH